MAEGLSMEELLAGLLEECRSDVTDARAYFEDFSHVQQQEISTSPTLKYVGHQNKLPPVVKKVLQDIQSHMTEDFTKRHKVKDIPDMPKEFLYSEVTEEESTVLDLAGVDLQRTAAPSCYEIIVPFLMTRRSKRLPPSYALESAEYLWSGNFVSFLQVSNDFVVVNIEAVSAKVKNQWSGEREEKLFNMKSTEIKDIPAKPVRKFLRSPLVCKDISGHFLMSSHKMTISWLRSRLDKALNRYKEVKKNVEVIATVQQKEGGPLFLNLKIEKGDTKHDCLFLFNPAFRATQCELLVPVFTKLTKSVPSTLSKSSLYCLWKKVIKCEDTSHTHKVTDAMHTISQSELKLLETAEETKEKEAKSANNDKDTYKSSIKTRTLSPLQQSQCEEIQNPCSRMLLEYYYQCGHIPDDEMQKTKSFVWEILTFLQAYLKKECKSNGPQLVMFLESGSVSENSKVVQPDEFDVAVVIDLPRSTEDYTFVEDTNFPTGYAICRVRQSKSFTRGLKKCFERSDEFGHCLAPEKLAFGWLYGMLERAINSYMKEKNMSGKADLKLRRGGPALLLEIKPSDLSTLPPEISVDLVLSLKLGAEDSRYAVAKPATEEHFYKKVLKEALPEEVQNIARNNLKLLWRISYSKQEKKYLKHIKEVQEKHGVTGCQNICLKILKTVCTQEVLKREESVICHKVSSYILKTALFHVLSTKTDWIKDWKMEFLAERYLDLLNQLSGWKELPHFFFNNADNLKKVFPEARWCETTTVSKNLLDELHATLKIQIFNRFADIKKSFKEGKERVDAELASECHSSDYHAFMKKIFGPILLEEVIHPPFNKSARPDEESKKSLVEAVALDRQVSKAAKDERKSGPKSNPKQHIQRAVEEDKRSKEREQNRRLKNYDDFDLDLFLELIRMVEVQQGQDLV